MNSNAPAPFVLARWSQSKKTKTNFGDALNPYVIRAVTRRRPLNLNRNRPIKWLNQRMRWPVLVAIGSILDYLHDQNAIIWGAGFKQRIDKIRTKPREVVAVRGPLSRENLVRCGIACPERYGDPAILMPRFYQPRVSIRYKLGVIAHYVDQDATCIPIWAKDTEVRVIDIRGEIMQVVDEINQCDAIASSSLHGLIVADAYGVPSAWLRLSDKIVGGSFKFQDYYASLGEPRVEAVVATAETTVDELVRKTRLHQVPERLQDELLSVCPFAA